MSGNTSEFGDAINVDYWSKRWQAGKSGWHQPHVNTGLTGNIHRYYRQPDKTLTPAQQPAFFLPLCGKTVDMQYLNEYGYNVVGVDGVQLSIDQYFDEQQQYYSSVKKEQLEHDTIKYTAIHNATHTTITIYVCDIFNKHLTSQLTGPLHCVFDRGSLVALPKHDRQRYADKIIELATPVSEPVTNYILQCVEYNETNPDGTLAHTPPPHHTPTDVVESLFKQHSTHFELIERKDDFAKESKRSSDLKYWYVVSYAIGLGKN